MQPTPAVRPGDRFQLRKEPVTTRQLVMYAGASGDYNRIHYDQPFAVEAGLGGVIAHGMLTMGFAAQCVTDWAGPGGIIREISGRFLTPVRPGDVVVVDGLVENVDEANCCRVSLTAHVENKPVFSGSAAVRLAAVSPIAPE
jgi:acyl dehydratase